MNSLDLSKPCTESLIWHLLLDPLLCGTLIKLSPTASKESHTQFASGTAQDIISDMYNEN